MLDRYELGAQGAASPAAERAPTQVPAAVRTAPQPAQKNTRPESRRAAGAGGEWIEV
jgi:hypothetical protein